MSNFSSENRSKYYTDPFSGILIHVSGNGTVFYVGSNVLPMKKKKTVHILFYVKKHMILTSVHVFPTIVLLWFPLISQQLLYTIVFLLKKYKTRHQPSLDEIELKQ